MIRSVMRIWAFALWMAVPTEALAGAIFLPNQGVRAQGQGGAFVASADDINALYWNPAALVRLKGWGLAGGATLAHQPMRFLRDGGEGRWKPCLDTEPECLDPASEDHASMLQRPYEESINEAPWRPIPELGLHYHLEAYDLTLALGLTTPVAPWIDLPRLDPGEEAPPVASRYRLIRARTDQARIAAAAAWQATPWMALGVTVEAVYLRLLQRFTATAHLLSGEGGNDENPDFDVDVTFEAKGVVPYGSIGFLFTPLAGVLDIGLGFQPPMVIRVPGHADLVKEDLAEGFIESSAGILGIDDPQAPDLDTHGDDLRVRLTLPPILRAGVAVHPHQRVTVEAATVVEFWQMTDRIVAEDVDVPLTDTDGRSLRGQLDDQGLCVGTICDRLPAAYRGDDGGGTTALPAGYQSTVRISVGGRVQLLPGPATRPRLQLRAGAFFETAGVPESAMTVSAFDNLRFGGGAALVFDHRGIGLSLAYSRVFVPDRVVRGGGRQVAALESTATNPVDAGRYTHMDAQMIGANLHLNLGEFLRRSPATGAD
jgi:long-subunit fatty acid transport protein